MLSVLRVFAGLQTLARLGALIGQRGSPGLLIGQAEALPLVPIGINFISHRLQLPVELQQRLDEMRQ